MNIFSTFTSVSLYDLDIIQASFLLYFVAFVWQYITHKIRFLMVKFYIENEYSFHSFAEAGQNMDYLSKSLGIGGLGISYRKYSKSTYSWIVDVIYYSFVFVFPVYLLSLSQKYLRYDSAESIYGFKRILYNGVSAQSFSLGMFWLVFCGVLPHLWAIYFNAKRYKYVRSEKDKNTWINPNMHGT